MSVKVFKTNKAGKIEFTRCELEKLLNETYREGYTDGENHAKSNYWTWTSPSIVNTPYYGTTITCDNGSAIRSNTVDGISSISGTVTLADKVTGSNNNDAVATSTINDAAPVNAIKVDVCASVDKAPEITAKVATATAEATAEAPAKTYELKGMTYNMDDLAKTIDAILNGKVDLFTPKSAPIDNPFSNLAKELRGI